MRIASIQTNNVNQHSFGGLWGKTSIVVDSDTVLGMTHNETYYYYPCLDETSASISEVVNANTDAYIDEKNAKYVTKECKVCTTLPFKDVHFQNYKNADASTRMTQNLKKVHYSVHDKYINNLGEQESAINPNIASRLNTKA